MFQGIEQYKGDANAFKEVKSALGRLDAELQQLNIAPHQFVKQMADTHVFLADQRIPADQRLAGAITLLRNYGLELPKAGATPSDPATPPYEDPEVKALREQVQALQSKQSETERNQSQTLRQQQERDLKAWAEDGKHPYFYDVADQMAILIKGSGGTMDRQTAYDQAMRLNPVTWAKEQERIATEAREAFQAEQRKKAAEAEAARRARVKTSGHQGGGAAITGSMDDTMKATLAAIKDRAVK